MSHLYLTKAVEAMARAIHPAIWDERLDALEFERPEIENQRTTLRMDALHMLREGMPHILDALIAKADADHDTAHDMSGHRATRAFWASEWLNDLAEDIK